VLAGLDVEDLISRGYTCSLADREGGDQPGVEIVCDDGVCAQCVKTREGIKPWLVRNNHLDVEDYLKLGYVCSKEFLDSRDAQKVCDDGLCVGCKKPRWTGGDGDVERFLERGFKCFLVRDVPEYGLAEGVEVVCDDGECFGCMKTGGSGKVEEAPLTVDEMLSLGYTCSVQSRREGEAESGLVCEGGKCYHCSPPALQELPVSIRFLDRAEDYLEDGYGCGLGLKSVLSDTPASQIILCEGELCLVCWVGNSKKSSQVRTIREASVEQAERLAKRGQECSVVFGRPDSASTSATSLCEPELCFVCRNKF